MDLQLAEMTDKSADYCLLFKSSEKNFKIMNVKCNNKHKDPYELYKSLTYKQYTYIVVKCYEQQLKNYYDKVP